MGVAPRGLRHIPDPSLGILPDGVRGRCVGGLTMEVLRAAQAGTSAWKRPGTFIGWPSDCAPPAFALGAAGRAQVAAAPVDVWDCAAACASAWASRS
jgi:hypothetical protein